MAMSGTVWLSTIHGSSAASAVRKRCMSSARNRPTTTPTIQPTAATPRLNAEAWSTACHIGSGAGSARDRLEQPADHVPDVRHREVGGARQHGDAADDDARRRAERLVELPDRGEQHDAEGTEEDAAE